MNNQNVLITGGAGYLGSLVCTELEKRGYNVTVVDKFLYGRKPLSHLASSPRVRLIDLDIRDMSEIAKILNDCDSVIHLAAIVGDPACRLNEKKTIEINLMSTRMIAGLCRLYNKPLIFASTCSVYGESGGRIFCEIDEVDNQTPVSVYGKTKLQSEKAILEEGPEHAIFRMGTLFGLSYRMRFDLAINLFVAKCVSKEPISLFGGNQYRPFIHVRDAARAYAMAIEHNWRGIFNLAWKNYDMGTAAREIATQLNGTVEEEITNTDRRSYRVCLCRISELGFKPELDLSVASEEIFQAFRSNQLDDYRSESYSNVKSLSSWSELKLEIPLISPMVKSN